jgi:hypothetical protein
MNKPLLLGLLGVLLCLRFIVTPVLEWQDKVLQETHVLQKKLDKSLAYIDDLPKLQQLKQALTVELAGSQAMNETFQDVGRYQLAKQRQLEDLFAESNANITSSNWLDPIKTAKGTTFQFRLQFAAETKNFIELHLKLSRLSKDISLTTLNLNVFANNDKALGRLSGILILRFSPKEADDAIN